MSYSFNFKVASKADALAKASDEWDAIVAAQPTHAKDRAQAMSTLTFILDTLADSEHKDVVVECYGSLSWVDSSDNITGCCIHVNAWQRDKGAA